MQDTAGNTQREPIRGCCSKCWHRMKKWHFAALAMVGFGLALVFIPLFIHEVTKFHPVIYHQGINYEPSDINDFHDRIKSRTTPMKTSKTTLKGAKKRHFEYFTCEEFKDEMKEFDENEHSYAPGFLYQCAQFNIWNWLKNECAPMKNGKYDLKDCAHPRDGVPGWKNFDGQIKLQANLRYMLVLFHKWSLNHPEFKYHFIGGTALGFLRHGDLIPHDHDLDIFVPNENHKMIIRQNIHEFPEDILLWRKNGMGVLNSCLPNCSHEIPAMDIFTPEDIKYFIGPNTGVPEWNWENDADPLHYLHARGYAFPMPNNWARAVTAEYKGRHALTYVPYQIDKEAHRFFDKMCPNHNYSTNKNFKSDNEWKTPWKIKNDPKKSKIHGTR